MATEPSYGCQIFFDNLSSRVNQLLFSRNETQSAEINLILDQLNTLNYKTPLVKFNNKAVLLIHQLCNIISPFDSVLVKKCCVLIINLITEQNVQLHGRTLTYTLQWCMQNLKLNEHPDVENLRCLSVLIRDNVEDIQEFLPDLLGPSGVLVKYTYSNEIQLWVVKCIEALCYVKDAQNQNLYDINDEYVDTCTKLLLNILMAIKNPDCIEITYCKTIISSLRGFQNILQQNSDIIHSDLGLLLGIAKYYMTYQLFETNLMRPNKLMPSNLSVADIKLKIPREKKGGKITKQRKQRKSTPQKKDTKRESAEAIPSTTSIEPISVMTSDSDQSDSETNKINRIASTQARVRQSALNLLLSIVKITDKHIMFGYWSSFFPDGSPTGLHSLNQCLLKDPSPFGRIAVLNVISTMLNDSKLYLSQAETSEKTFAFTPFSMVLGSMVQELHDCLCAALKDNSIPVITQILKCLALLVQATPYHRLKPGLISNIIKKVRPFIRHRDATIQVAALIVLGCVLASEPIVSETLTNLTQLQPRHHDVKNDVKTDESEIEYAEFSSDEETTIFEPVIHLPWLLEKCLRNLGVIFNLSRKNEVHLVPAPVKLESLQVLSAMCRNYFHLLLAPYILQVGKAIELSLLDKYMDLRLHAGRAVDCIGHAMQQHIASLDEPKTLSIEKGLAFWQLLLNGQLTISLQHEHHSALRAIACDCLGNIGPDIFEHLPKLKQILIISLLFACSREKESSIKGAAVRALAISVMYPSLREDIGFVMDTAEAIMRTLDDTNVTVRIKSSWSLGNLSDALVTYQNTNTNEPLPNALIIDLLRASIKIAADNNKIKSNAARAIGNLLRLISSRLLEQTGCHIVTEQAIIVLVHNSNSCPDMKVRWNSCYAIGNFMRNNELFIGGTTWQIHVYNLLTDLVVNFRNFKVRINAALALSVPEKRTHYGLYYFKIWKSLLTALDNTQNIDDFSELKHRDNLIDQICLSLSHLATFLTNEDLNQLYEILMYHIDSFKIHFHRVQERLVPERSEVLLRAASHVKQLHLEKDENEIIMLLNDLFINEDCI